MKIAYLFDIDGTLTPPTEKMQGDFVYSFLNWSSGKDFFLVGGSSHESIAKQVPFSVISRASGIFSSMANELRIKDRLIYKNEWKASVSLLSKLLQWHSKSPYPNKRKRYVESRVGMLNFSVAGRESSHEERRKYFEWDQLYSERQTIAADISKNFPHLDVRLGGMISLDIQPKGFNKAQAVKYVRNLNKYDCIHYFGDKGFEGGNDYDARLEIENNDTNDIFYAVKDCRDTKKLLFS
jgi:phosphomannomutase